MSPWLTPRQDDTVLITAYRPSFASSHEITGFFGVAGAVWREARLTDASPISHISCGGDILTAAQLWAQIVNSRFSMAKYYHVFSAAEACKRCWPGGGAGWVRGLFGLGLNFFTCQEASL